MRLSDHHHMTYTMLQSSFLNTELIFKYKATKLYLTQEAFFEKF